MKLTSSGQLGALQLIPGVGIWNPASSWFSKNGDTTIEFVVEVLLTALWEIFLQFGVILLGALAGAIASFVWPTRILQPGPVRGASLVLSPTSPGQQWTAMANGEKIEAGHGPMSTRFGAGRFLRSAWRWYILFGWGGKAVDAYQVRRPTPG
jgi:hypothetical protein